MNLARASLCGFETAQRLAHWRVGYLRGHSPVGDPFNTEDSGLISTQSRPPKRGTLLGHFYRSVRCEIVASKSVSYVWLYDAAINRAAEWCGPVALAAIDEQWLTCFESYLVADGVRPKSANNLMLCIRRLVSRVYPYRFCVKASWGEVERCFLTQPHKCVGSYYVRIFEPNLPYGTSQRRHLRTAIWRFHLWAGRAVALHDVDNDMLKEFEQHEIERGTSKTQSRQLQRFMRQIVNHKNPRKISRKYDPPAPPITKAGTVQHFAENVYLPQKKLAGKRLLRFRKAVRLFHKYCGERGVPFARFTNELCSEFLEWCLKKGNDGKPVGGMEVNEGIRFVLVSLSKAAVTAGLMKRRLHLEPVGEVRRRRVNRRTPIEPMLSEQLQEARRKGGKNRRKWTPEVDQIAREINAGLGTLSKHARSNRIAARLVQHGYTFSSKTVSRRLEELDIA